MDKYAVDAMQRKRVVHTTYVRATSERDARDLGYRAHLLLGIRKRHGPIRVQARIAPPHELGCVRLATTGEAA